MQPEGGLLIDPTASEATDAIAEAFQTASEEEATLVLALIGHGTFAGRDFFFLPRDGSERSLYKTGIHLAQLIKSLYQVHSRLDGLVVLIDSCFSGAGALSSRFVDLEVDRERPGG